MRTKDKKGLYFQGKLKGTSYSDAIKELYKLKKIPSGFCVNFDHEANGYSVVGRNGVQKVYETAPAEFYEALMSL